MKVPWDQDAGFAEDGQVSKGLVTEDVLQGSASGSFDAHVL